MLEFVHLSGQDAGKDSQTRKKVRAQAMRDFRRRQREEREAAAATLAAESGFASLLQLPKQRRRASSTPPTNTVVQAGISKRSSKTKSRRSHQSLACSPQSEPSWGCQLHQISTISFDTSPSMPILRDAEQQQTSQSDQLPLMPMSELSPGFEHTWSVNDSTYFGDQSTTAPSMPSLDQTTHLDPLLLNFDDDPLATKFLEAQGAEWPSIYPTQMPLWMDQQSFFTTMA